MSTVTKRKYTHVLRTWNADQNGKSVYPFRSKRRKTLPDEWESLLRNNNIIRVYMGILKTAFLVVKNSPEYMHHNLLPCWLNYGAFSAILMVSAPLERVLVLPLSFQRYTIMLLLLWFIKLPLFCWKACSPLNIYHAIDSDCVSQSDCGLRSMLGWLVLILRW